MTGPKYGRIWNNDVLAALMDRFGDGRSGDFRIPGEFGAEVEITRDNTTLFAGDRDMFIFLADEVNRIDLPGRRDGQAGELARGFLRVQILRSARARSALKLSYSTMCARIALCGVLMSSTKSR
jgi:hypothetical protein